MRKILIVEEDVLIRENCQIYCVMKGIMSLQ